jgi:ABC-type transport system involved in cytochrome bd biosynthesis fused ATPase/permease subunit
LIRFICEKIQGYCSFLSSKNVKKTLRERLYLTMIKLGASYSEKISTSEVVQVSTEGVEQFEIYLGKYLPQFYYAMIDLLILFVIFSIMSLKIGFVLFFFSSSNSTLNNDIFKDCKKIAC